MVTSFYQRPASRVYSFASFNLRNLLYLIIALGPEYVGKGYGKQILRLLLEYCASTMGSEEFYYSTQAVNQASRALALSCGFSYHHSEQRIDLQSGEPYELEVYHKKL